MHAMYCRDPEGLILIYGLQFVKISDTEHHYRFTIQKYNNVSLNNFIPYIRLNDTGVGSPYDIPLRATIEDDNGTHYVRVLIGHPTVVGYTLKVEVDDETFVKLL
jgi:hypothetical protein